MTKVPASTKTIKLLIVDDHEVVRTGLNRKFDPYDDIDVIGEAENGEEAVKLYMKLKPDVVVMDISMPIKNGTEATKEIVELDPDARVVVFSINEEAIITKRMFDAGAKGYISKGSVGKELIKAIRLVADGNIYFSPDIAQALAEQNVTGQVDPFDKLSGVKMEIFKKTAEGKEPKTIAEELGISVVTVRSHLDKVRQILKVNTAAEMARLAIRTGVIEA